MLRLASISARQPIRRMGVPVVSQRFFSPARTILSSSSPQQPQGPAHVASPASSWGFRFLGGALLAGAGYALVSQASWKTIHGKDLEAEGAVPAPAAAAEPTTEPAAAAPAAPVQGESEAKAEEPSTPPPKPKSTKPAPLYIPYVVIGTGTAAFSAANAIRTKNPDAQILLIGDEGEIPYNRTPLSKELWHTEDPKIAENLVYKQWDGKQRSLYYEPAESFVDPFSEEGQTEILRHKIKASPQAPKQAEAEVPEGDAAQAAPVPEEEPLLNRIKVTYNKAVALNVDTQMITLANGQKVYYEKLLIATGGTPRRLPLMNRLAPEVSQHVTTYRKLSDFKNLEALTAGGNKHVAVIGGGFLGSELACSLAHRAKSTTGLQVTQIFPEEGNMGLVFPKYLSEWTTGKLRQEGINVVTKALVTDILPREGGGVTLVMKSGQTLDVDHVVVAVGINANMDLARKAGLEIDERRGGIVVNAELESRRNIFAAGDASSYHDIALGRRRVEHYEHAVVSGKVAGENMAGARKPYKHQPMFWSDLGPKIGYEAVGLIDSSLVTVGVWAKATAKDTPQAAAASGNIRSADVGDIKDSSEVTKEAAPAPEVPEVPQDDDKYGKGIVYYLKNKKVVGVLTWNMFNKMKSAREIIREGKEFSDYSELAKLIKIESKDHH